MSLSLIMDERNKYEQFLNFKQLVAAVFRYDLGIAVPPEMPSLAKTAAAIDLLRRGPWRDNDLFKMDVLRRYVLDKGSGNGLTRTKSEMIDKLEALQRQAPDLGLEPFVAAVRDQFHLDDPHSQFVSIAYTRPAHVLMLPPAPCPSERYIAALRVALEEGGGPGRDGGAGHATSASDVDAAPPYIPRDAQAVEIERLQATVSAQAAEIERLHDTLTKMEERLVKAGL